MDEREWLTERFEQHRPHLRAVAYRMLGSVSETDDALQEAWLRIRDQDPGTVEHVQAWLTTVVGRVCLNMLRSRRKSSRPVLFRREAGACPGRPQTLIAGFEPGRRSVVTGRSRIGGGQVLRAPRVQEVCTSPTSLPRSWRRARTARPPP